MITNEELNPIEIWKNKESELIRKGFEPVLDRTKEIGTREPLYLDVLSVLKDKDIKLKGIIQYLNV